MDIISNRLTPRHYDKGRALSFYDHLVSFGQVMMLNFCFMILMQVSYQSGTSVLFPGKVLAHSVQSGQVGEVGDCTLCKG